MTRRNTFIIYAQPANPSADDLRALFRRDSQRDRVLGFKTVAPCPRPSQLQQLGPEGRSDAVSLIREANQLLTEALHWMAEVASFFAPANLANLLEWGRDHRCPVGLRGAVGSTLQIGPWEGKRVIVRLPSHVTEPPPSLAPLIEQTVARSRNRSDGHEDEEG